MRSRPRPEQEPASLSRRIVTATAAALPVLLWAGVTNATTIIPVAFDDMVRASETIVVVRVTNTRTTEVMTKGYKPAPRREGDAGTRAPLEGVTPEAGSSASQSASAPVSAGIKPGRVLFTHLTLVVEETVKGRAPAVLNLRTPGGTLRGATLVIVGLPEFATGERYLLFLRPDAERVGDPVVGVNQGFFRLVSTRTGAPAALVTESGDYVIAVEDNRVVVKAGPARAAERPVPALGPLPEAEMGVPADPIQSAAERRYWDSAEPPMTVAGMAAAVRAVPGWADPVSRIGAGR